MRFALGGPQKRAALLLVANILLVAVFSCEVVSLMVRGLQETRCSNPVCSSTVFVALIVLLAIALIILLLHRSGISLRLRPRREASQSES